MVKTKKRVKKTSRETSETDVDKPPQPRGETHAYIILLQHRAMAARREASAASPMSKGTAV
jgi:hypothetical protein